MENRKILFTASAGGHYTQLKSLIAKMKPEEYLILTEKTEFEKKSERVKFLRYSTTASKFYVFSLLSNTFRSLFVLLLYMPDVIISTGAHSTIPVIVLGKILRRKVIFIESFAKVYTRNRTGRFIYKHNLYDLFVVQWKELLEIYPNAVYGGSIYWF